ncbi:uncharacterized protein LOC143233352 isoform X2 [Tachypleus tridentatus]|uniref:uncharacterized protein LOC143233352 isoform X2 n=1 Tax=Tachypleus tridentatus TaxID=6853 RepID=UPI003FCF0FB5
MIGDMVSVIDMPPPEESTWWRGKRRFEVGFFPSECVEVIGEKVPQVFKIPTVPTKPVLRKQGKLIAFFRSFLLSRPSRRKLKQSGILKERVFGCDLGEHLLNTSREIPLVLKCCTEFIETHGIVDGVYRLSGVTSNIQKLRLAFDEDRAPDLHDEAILQDIHCVASLLKMYFRELPNPLLTYQLYDKFVSAVQAEEDVRLLRLRDVVQQLPPPHYRTLEFLVRHLAKVASRGNQTSMTPKNIAIVWAPNLLRSKDVEGGGGVGALHVVGVQAVLTEYLIRYVDLIFNNRLPVFHSPTFEQDSPRKQRPKSLAISTPTKLLSLEEARVKALSSNLPIFQQKYIDVGGGPDNLPAKYHTILEFPTSSKRCSGKGKKSPSGWKSFFSRGWHSGSTREKDRGSQRPISNPRKASTGSLKYTTTVLPLQETTVIETDGHSKKLRAVKSAESLISSLPSNGTSCRNSQVSESSGSAEEDNMNWSSRSSKKNENSQHPSPYKSPNVHSSHIRSLSHDSYFEKSVDISNEQIDEENEENVFLQIDSKLNFSWKDSNTSETRRSTELLPFSLDTMFKQLKDAETMGGQEKCFSVDGRHTEKNVEGLCDEFFVESQDTFQKKKLRCSDSDVSSSKMQKLNFQNFHQAFSSPSFSNKLESSVTFSDEDNSPSIGKEMDNNFVQGSIEETKDLYGQTLSLDMLNKKYSSCSTEEKLKNAINDLQVNDRIEVHQKAGKELSENNSCTVENNVDKKPVKLLTSEETMLPPPVSDTVEVDDGVGKTVVERYGNEETIIVEVHATHEGSSDEDEKIHESHHIACNTQQTASGKREEGELQKFQTRGEQNLDCSSNLVQSFSAETTLSNSVSLSQLESSQDLHQGTINLTDKSNICHSSSFPEECSINNSVLLDLVKLPDKSEGKQHNLERNPQPQTSPPRNFFLGECPRFIPEINQTDSKEPVFSSSSVSLEDGDQEISDVEELFKYKLLDEQETLNTPINRMQMNEMSPLKNHEVHEISSDFSDLAEKDNVSTVHVPPPIFPSYCSLEWNKENNVKSCPFEQEPKCSDTLRKNTHTHTATIDKDVHPTFILDNLESSKPQEALMKQNFCVEEVCDNSLQVNSHMITKEQVKSHHQDASDFENVVSFEMEMNETDSSAQIPNITSNQKFETSDSQPDWSDSAIEKCSIYEQSPPLEESRCKFESEIEKSIKKDYQIKVKMEQVQAKNNKKYPPCDSKFSSTPKQVQKTDSSKEHTKDEKKMLDGVELRKYPGRQLEKFSEDHEIDKKWNVDSHVTFHGANRSSMLTERKRLSEPAMTNLHPKFIPMDKKDSVRTLLSKFETPSQKENNSVSETNFQEMARNYLNESLKKNKLSSTHLFSQIKVFKPQSEQSTGTASIKYDPLSDPVLEHDIHPQDLLQIHTSTPNAGKLEVQKALSWGPEEMSVTTMNYAKKSLDYVKPQTLNFENVLHQDHMSKKQGNSKAFLNSSIQDKEDKDSETQELSLPLGKKGDLESPTHLVSQNRKTNISPVKWHSFSPLSSPIREVTPFLPVNSIIRNQKEQVCYLKEDHRSWDKERWKSDTNNKLRRMNSEPESGCQTSLGQATSLSSTIDNQGGASESMHTKNEMPPVSSVFEDQMDEERGEVWVRERAQRWQKHISEKMGYVPLSHSSNHCGPKSFSEGLNSTNKLGGSPWKRGQKPPIMERQLLKSPVKKTPESLPPKMKPIPAPRTSLVKKNVILDEEGSENVPNVALSEETTCRVASVDMCEEGNTSYQKALSAPKCIRDRAAMFEHSATSPQKSLAQSSNNHSSKS